MTMGRNDFCPCGSGKKYKKCCLKKESITNISQLPADQFFQLKYQLTIKMLRFLDGNLPAWERLQAISQFKKVQQKETSPKIKEYNNHFWLCYFYTFKNGLRGVEWFDRKANNLSIIEKELLARWVQMRPRLLQATKMETSGITVTDLITKEEFFLPYCESLNRAWPWGISVTMIEPFGEAYCVHGVTSFKSPSLGHELTKIIYQKMDNTGQNYPDVMLNSFLELSESTIAPPQHEEMNYLPAYQEEAAVTLNKPIPLFEDQTPLQLAESGETDVLESWIREVEYRGTIVTKSVESALTINPIRKALGLPLSPFAPKEQSGTVDTMTDQVSVISEEDFVFYQQLGITHETAFYGTDLVTFFKEKTIGKSVGTVKKYEWGLQKFVHFCNQLGELLPNCWSACTQSFWHDMIHSSQDERANKNQSFRSTIRGFTKWLDKNHVSNHSLFVDNVLEAIEEPDQEEPTLVNV
ncbi:MAG TPA: SEC-C metal-binding domain-containing protein [Bacillota bacterium]|nr:SEC-C metal-binding domain-containing protein [Bacillota bacterium]